MQASGLTDTPTTPSPEVARPSQQLNDLPAKLLAKILSTVRDSHEGPVWQRTQDLKALVTIGGLCRHLRSNVINCLASREWLLAQTNAIREKSELPKLASSAQGEEFDLTAAVSALQAVARCPVNPYSWLNSVRFTTIRCPDRAQLSPLPTFRVLHSLGFSWEPTQTTGGKSQLDLTVKEGEAALSLADRDRPQYRKHVDQKGGNRAVEAFERSLQRNAGRYTADASGNTPLHELARGGHAQQQEIDLLLKSGADINTQNLLGETALHLAAPDPTLFSALLARGADLTIGDRVGDTPVHRFFAQKLTGKLPPLDLEKFPPTLKNFAGEDILHAAAKGGSKPLFQLAIEMGAKGGVDNRGRSVLHTAARANAYGLIRWIADQDGDLVAQCKRGRTPLHEAAEVGADLAVLALLELESLDLELRTYRDKEQRTPLHLAAMNGHLNAVRLLIAPGVQEDQSYFLHLALMFGQSNRVKQLLRPVHYFDQRDGYDLYALEYAAIRRHVTIINELLAARVEQKRWLSTPDISYWRVRSLSESDRALLEKFRGVSLYPFLPRLLPIKEQINDLPRLKDEVLTALGFLDPLQLAIFHNDQSRVEEVMGRAEEAYNGMIIPRLEKQGPGGFGPLHLASMLGYVEILKKLIKNGANPSARHKSGETLQKPYESGTDFRVFDPRPPLDYSGLFGGVNPVQPQDDEEDDKGASSIPTPSDPPPTTKFVDASSAGEEDEVPYRRFLANVGEETTENTDLSREPALGSPTSFAVAPRGRRVFPPRRRVRPGSERFRWLVHDFWADASPNARQKRDNNTGRVFAADREPWKQYEPRESADVREEEATSLTGEFRGDPTSSLFDNPSLSEEGPFSSTGQEESSQFSLRPEGDEISINREMLESPGLYGLQPQAPHQMVSSIFTFPEPSLNIFELENSVPFPFQPSSLEKLDLGVTPLMCAADAGHVECVRALLEANADVQMADYRGWNALHFAVSRGYLEIVQMLQEAGCPLKAGPGKITARQLAVEAGQDEVVAYFDQLQPSPAPSTSAPPPSHKGKEAA